jgi:hypothetical protein
LNYPNRRRRRGGRGEEDVVGKKVVVGKGVVKGGILVKGSSGKKIFDITTNAGITIILEELLFL